MIDVKQYPALHAILHRYGISPGTTLEQQEQARQECENIISEVERMRRMRDERYDDNLRDANHLVGDMMAQRDEALAKWEQALAVVELHAATLARVEAFRDDWQADVDSYGSAHLKRAPSDLTAALKGAS